MQNFIEELSNYLGKNIANNLEVDDKWNNLLSDNLKLYDKNIISKYKDEMLIERANILQDYAQNTKDKGEMYYVYNNSTNEKDTYNLCACDPEKSNKVIEKQIEELPAETKLGSVLRRQGEKFILDKEDSRAVAMQINKMIKEKISEQEQYLESKRIEGHIYKVEEKYSERIWLYDLNNKIGGGTEEIEEIEFPQSLYEVIKAGELLIYKNGKYQKYE